MSDERNTLDAAGNVDPVLVRRAQFATAADLGKRYGYLLYLVAMVAFFVALIVGFSDTSMWIVIGALIAGSILLLPAIIIGYAVSAADRADLGLPDGH